MNPSQLHDFAATKKQSEHTPVHMLKREGMSLESEEADRHAGKGKRFETADYISQARSNPHESPAAKKEGFYKDHGRGNRKGEEDTPREDRNQKGRNSNEPRQVDEGASKRKKYGFPNLAEPYEED